MCRCHADLIEELNEEIRRIFSGIFTLPADLHKKACFSFEDSTTMAIRKKAGINIDSSK
jgi:hypothetical protein